MIKFMDGFDHYPIDNILYKWSQTSAVFTGTGTNNISEAWGNGLGKGLELNNSAWVQKNLGGNYETLIFGGYFKIVASTFAASTLVYFYDNETAHCRVALSAAGFLQVYRSTTLIATAASAISLNTWYHLEFKATIGDSAAPYEVRINGATSPYGLSGTGDLRNGANAYATSIRIYGHGASSTYTYWDDIYVLDTVAPNNDFIGPHKVYSIFPTASGSNIEWTPNWLSNYANINETGPDNDLSFNYATVSGVKDTFDYQNSINGTVDGIQTVILAKQDAGVQRVVAPYVLYTGSGIVASGVEGDQFSPSTSYLYYLDQMDRDPLDNKWTKTSLDDSEFGYKLVS